MEKLYIETKNGNVPIDPEIAKKFNLEKGTLSPFTRSRIVGKDGEFSKETASNKAAQNHDHPPKSDDGVAETENVKFSTSEIIDLAHGEDSPTGQ